MIGHRNYHFPYLYNALVDKRNKIVENFRYSEFFVITNVLLERSLGSIS